MTNPLPDPTATAPARRLLGGWADVLDDIRALCRNLQDLPDVCQCGHAPAHLEGSCLCCGTTTTARVPSCRDCDRQLAALRPAMDALTADTFRFFPVVKEVMTRDDPGEGQRARTIEQHIATLVRSFDQLVVADGQFKSECRASHLHTLKEAAAALQRDAEALNHLI